MFPHFCHRSKLFKLFMQHGLISQAIACATALGNDLKCDHGWRGALYCWAHHDLPPDLSTQLFRIIESAGGVWFHSLGKAIPAVVHRHSADSYNLILEAITAKSRLDWNEPSPYPASLLAKVIKVSTTTKLEHRRVSAIALRLIALMSDATLDAANYHRSLFELAVANGRIGVAQVRITATEFCVDQELNTLWSALLGVTSSAPKCGVFSFKGGRSGTSSASLRHAQLETWTAIQN